MSKRYDGMEWLHPRFRKQFESLQDALKADYLDKTCRTLFLPFETYRTPFRQAWLSQQKNRVTGAKQYESAHQFGCAVDFVPFDGGAWSWDPHHAWEYLALRAGHFGLERPWEWDLAHIQVPDIKTVVIDKFRYL